MWQCPLLPKEALGIANSAHFVTRAISQADTQPCLWLRGLAPASWEELPQPPTVEEVIVHKWGIFTEYDDDHVFDLTIEPYRSWKWYTDGSGGLDASELG